MAASPSAMDTQDKWSTAEAQGAETMGPVGNVDSANGAPVDGQGDENPDFTRGSSVGGGSKADSSFREKQVKVLSVRLSLFFCLVSGMGCRLVLVSVVLP